jgi:hypothetical protein
VRFEDDAIRPDIPNPHFQFSRDPVAPRPLTWLRKTKAETIRGGKFGVPAEIEVSRPGADRIGI